MKDEVGGEPYESGCVQNLKRKVVTTFFLAAHILEVRVLPVSNERIPLHVLEHVGPHDGPPEHCARGVGIGLEEQNDPRLECLIEVVRPWHEADAEHRKGYGHEHEPDALSEAAHSSTGEHDQSQDCGDTQKQAYDTLPAEAEDKADTSEHPLSQQASLPAVSR